MLRNEKIIVGVLLLLFALICFYLFWPPLTHPAHETNDWFIPSRFKTIITAQQEFKEACIIDANNNGVGQYGFLSELSLEDQKRFTKKLDINCPFIPKSQYWKPNNEGVLSLGGYCMKMILPSEIDAKNGNDEGSFLIYAWPKIMGKTGKQLLVANQSGIIYYIQPSPFSGPNEIPNWDFAAAKMSKGIIEIDTAQLFNKGWKQRE